VDGDGTVPCESAMVSETFLLNIQNLVAVCHSQCVSQLWNSILVMSGQASDIVN
jgi:hypothetical protein